MRNLCFDNMRIIRCDIYVNGTETSDCPPCKSLPLAEGRLYLLFDSPAAQAEWFQDEAGTVQALLIFDCATGHAAERS